MDGLDWTRIVVGAGALLVGGLMMRVGIGCIRRERDWGAGLFGVL